MRILTLVLSILVLSLKLQAGELQEYYTSVRAMGMGNAFTAVATGRDSIFYNPAALAHVGGVNITLAGLQGGIDRTDAVQTVQGLQDSSKYIETLRNQYGKPLWGGAQGLTGIIAPSVGFAAFNRLEAAAQLSNPAAPNMALRYTNDVGFVGAVGVDILSNLQLGFSFMRISRKGIDSDIGISTLGSLSDQDLKNKLENTGVAYAGSMSLLGSLPNNIANPRAVLMIRNFGSSYFTRESGTEDLGFLSSEIAIGTAFDIPLGILTITPSFDYKYFNATSEQMGKKIHFGAEVNFLFLSVRGGFNQGYYTAGAGLDLGFMTLDAATYGVELGEYPGQLEDRRYVASLTLEFGFGDDSISSGGKSNTGISTGSGGRGGPRSRIKPRR